MTCFLQPMQKHLCWAHSNSDWPLYVCWPLQSLALDFLNAIFVAGVSSQGSNQNASKIGSNMKVQLWGWFRQLLLKAFGMPGYAGSNRWSVKSKTAAHVFLAHAKASTLRSFCMCNVCALINSRLIAHNSRSQQPQAWSILISCIETHRDRL